MPQTLRYTGELVITTCWCGIAHAMPRDLYNEAHRIEKSTYCPLGHAGIYTNTETDRLRKRAASLEAQLTAERDQREATERSLRSTKAAKTRLKNRVAKGVCPFCKRTFENLARHCETKHADEVVG